MTNVITVQMQFYFKGEEHNYQTEVKLPLHLGNMTDFYYNLPRKIAEKNGVDTYSYMYDMMESTPIEVIAAQGYVSRFLENGTVSMDEFAAECQKITPERLLQDIAKRVDTQSENALTLEKALTQAYQIGLSQGAANE